MLHASTSDEAVVVDPMTHEKDPPGFRRNKFGRRLVIGWSRVNRQDLLYYGPYTCRSGSWYTGDDYLTLGLGKPLIKHLYDEVNPLTNSIM